MRRRSGLYFLAVIGALGALTGCSTSGDDTSGPDATGPDATTSSDGSGATGPDATSPDATSPDATSPDATKSTDASKTSDTSTGTKKMPDGSPSQADVAVTTDGGPSSLSPAAQEVLQDIKVFQNGGTIAKAGNLSNIVVTVGANGSRTVNVAGTGGIPRLQITQTAPGQYTLVADQNLDGKVDDQVTVTTANGITTRVWEQDQNLNGAFNWRNTTVQTKDYLSSVVEEIPTFGTTFVTTSAYSGSALQFEANCATMKSPLLTAPGGACDPLAPAQQMMFPPTPKYCITPNPPTPPCVPSPSVMCPCGDVDAGQPICVSWDFPENLNPPLPSGDWIPSFLSPVQTDTGDGLFYYATAQTMACDATSASLLDSALGEALGDLAIIAGINTDHFIEILSGLGNFPLYYGCELPKSALGQSVLAVTGLSNFDVDKNFPWQNSKITAIDSSVFTAGKNALEEIIVHEWFHMAGINHPVDVNGEQQRDFIYSCARVADGCRAFADGFYLGWCCDASSARDNAQCASPDNKLQFGFLNIFKETAAGFVEDPNSTFSGFTDMDITAPTCDDKPSYPPGSAQPVQTTCTCYLEQTPSYCDQTVMSQNDQIALGVIGAAMTLERPNCCEVCDSTTPYSALGPCQTNMTALPSQGFGTSGMGYLPTNGGFAAGPTPKYRGPVASIAAGQGLAADTTTPMNPLNCPPIAGCGY